MGKRQLWPADCGYLVHLAKGLTVTNMANNTDDTPGITDMREIIARIIDPEAFGLSAHIPSDGSDYLSDRDEARDKASIIISKLKDAAGGKPG